jgi:hypothetical protein
MRPRCILGPNGLNLVFSKLLIRSILMEQESYMSMKNGTAPKTAHAPAMTVP